MDCPEEPGCRSRIESIQQLMRGTHRRFLLFGTVKALDPFSLTLSCDIYVWETKFSAVAALFLPMERGYYCLCGRVFCLPGAVFYYSYGRVYCRPEANVTSIGFLSPAYYGRHKAFVQSFERVLELAYGLNFFV